MKNRSSLRDLPFLYLTTTGRTSGLPREIEIWFVIWRDKLYVLSEYPDRANWVKNIRHDSLVRIRVGKIDCTARARLLDEQTDCEAWQMARKLAFEKYRWNSGTVLEITPDEPVTEW